MIKNKVAMRISKNKEAKCACCGNGIEKSVDIFDMKIGDNIFSVCDLCIEDIIYKAIKAKSYTNGRVKSEREIAKINERNRNTR